MQYTRYTEIFLHSFLSKYVPLCNYFLKFLNFLKFHIPCLLSFYITNLAVILDVKSLGQDTAHLSILDLDACWPDFSVH